MAGQLVQMLFAARASSLGAVEEIEKDIAFSADGGLQFVFRKIKGWKNDQQKSTGRKLPFRRQGRDAVPRGMSKRTRQGKDHFRNRAFSVIRFAIENGLLKQWTSAEAAAREITDGLEKYGIKKKNPGQIISSHSGRKTCVSARMELGAAATVMQEWMLTASDQTERYRQRGYQLNAEFSQLFDFLMERKS